MGNGGVYVNLLSHSPINTPCADYRLRGCDFIDDAIIHENVRNKEATTTTNISCEVEIHTESSKDHEIRNLLDFDTDDENILSSLNVLVSDGSSLDLTPQKFAYPDANSHSNYNLLQDDTPSSEVSRSRNLDVPLIRNNHKCNQPRNTGHPIVDESQKILSSDNSELNPIESYDPCSSYSVANSHLVYGILSEESEKISDDLSRERLISFDPVDNYEIANSHSNYQVLYNRDDFIDPRTGHDQLNNHSRFDNSSSLSDRDYDCQKFHHFARSRIKFLQIGNSPPNESESTNASSKSTEETTTSTCDIEDCLIQIEESLMNIEQNLLHVQELDLPEFKSLLYETPSIERNISDFKDILTIENIALGKKININVENHSREEKINSDREFGDKRVSLDRDTSKNKSGTDRFEAERTLTEKLPADRDLSEKSMNEKRQNEDDGDDNILQFTDEFSVSENIEYSTSLPSSTRDSHDYPNADKNVNFIPNSLGKIPTRYNIAKTKENIPVDVEATEKNDSRRRSLDDDLTDLINYNLNNLTIDKSPELDPKVSQSRTNSLDENSMYRFSDERKKASLENLRSELRMNSNLSICAKARSENAIGNLVAACSIVREKPSNRASEKSRQVRIAEVEAKAEEFRRMIENIVTNRCVTGRASFDTVKSNRTSKNHCHRSSPKSCSTANRNNEKNNEILRDRDNNSPSNNKPYTYEKKKRKKLANRSQSGDNALVPSKIISLSLSLLLAALLQAVRCLADLVEDAFRSVSFEKNNLLD